MGHLVNEIRVLEQFVDECLWIVWLCIVLVRISACVNA
eukprot:XP_001708610.1 Hypothetical protein GL50803_35855 [Giardia lamblia ATCC 50803]